jgi:hypothetical protein
MTESERKHTTVAEQIAVIREKINKELNETPFIIPKPKPNSPVPISPKPKPDESDQDETDEAPPNDESDEDEAGEAPPELPPGPGLPIPPEYVKPRPKP